MSAALFALDWGAGNLKLWGYHGGIVLPSQAATAMDVVVAGNAVGLKSSKPPMEIRLNGHRFYTGGGAHDWGRPVENLDDGRFMTGSPELRALTYAAFTEYGVEVSSVPGDVDLWVGLPQSAVTQEMVNGIRSWLRGEHSWWASIDGRDEEPRATIIENITATSQAAGALFDYLLDDTGRFIPSRKAHFKREIGIISVGMNTLEMLVVEGGKPKERFTACESSGVRRLLDLTDPRGMYSRGELDTALRAGSLDVRDSIPVWGSEVCGHIERHWGRAAERFAATIVVGGGATMLWPQLTLQLHGKGVVADDPILAVARGLYKLAIQRKNRRGV